MAASMLDPTTVAAMVVEANAITATRTRAWDSLGQGVVTSQLNFLNVPTVLVGQGARMLNGTPTTAPLQAPLQQGA